MGRFSNLLQNEPISRLELGVTALERTPLKFFMSIEQVRLYNDIKRLRAFIKSRISDDAATEDILQDVFLKAHSSLASLKDDTKLKSWLYQIARNAIVDYFRSQKPSVDVPEWFPQPETDPGEKITQELSECLQPMIQLLPKNYREAILLSEIKGLGLKEVAKMQGTSLSGAKSRVQRGRALLKKILSECCHLEFDHSGRLCNYEHKNGTRDFC